MKSKIGVIIVAATAYFAFIAFWLVGVSIDLYFNPWIRELQLQWWNIFTTHHYATWLFTTGQWSWLILASIPSVIIAFCVVIWLWPD